jgi:hypothetical protein
VDLGSKYTNKINYQLLVRVLKKVKKQPLLLLVTCYVGGVVVGYPGYGRLLFFRLPHNYFFGFRTTNAAGSPVIARIWRS